MRKGKITLSIITGLLVLGVYLSHWFFTIPAILLLLTYTVGFIMDKVKGKETND